MKNKTINRFIFLMGFLLCMYPLFSSIYDQHQQNKMISTYFTSVEQFSDEDLTQQIDEARQYNENLYRGYVVSDYEKIMCLTDNGMIAQIQIPSINVSLPIYHGTSEDVLSVGVGHLPSSSFPVGGINTRAVLTGHRGMASAKLFTRLDELEINDYFYINVGKEVLAYKIMEIEVIEPEQLEKLSIVDNEDLVSLITCTPYGINTHRLVITGKRTPYSREAKTKTKHMSLRESLFVLIPIILLILYFLKGKVYEKKNCT